MSMLVDKTRHEVWFSKKYSLAHLKAFGCDDFVHVTKEKRSKLDNKIRKGILIGYQLDGVKDDKLQNPLTKKEIYSQDVIFTEVDITSNNEDVPKEK